MHVCPGTHSGSVGHVFDTRAIFHEPTSRLNAVALWNMLCGLAVVKPSVRIPVAHSAKMKKPIGAVGVIGSPKALIRKQSSGGFETHRPGWTHFAHYQQDEILPISSSIPKPLATAMLVGRRNLLKLILRDPLNITLNHFNARQAPAPLSFGADPSAGGLDAASLPGLGGNGIGFESADLSVRGAGKSTTPKGSKAKGAKAAKDPAAVAAAALKKSAALASSPNGKPKKLPKGKAAQAAASTAMSQQQVFDPLPTVHPQMHRSLCA